MNPEFSNRELTNCGLPPEIWFSILMNLNTQKDRSVASQVCRTFYELIKETSDYFCKEKCWHLHGISFKLTTIRFLVIRIENNQKIFDSNNGYKIQVDIEKNSTLICSADLHFTNRTEEFDVYEANGIPAILQNVRLASLKWTAHLISIANGIMQKTFTESNYQIAPDDLDCTYFVTGKKYKSKSDERVIGSRGMQTKFICACGIKMVSEMPST